jgi:hypothetical protein
MTDKEFTNKVTQSKRDFLGDFIALLEKNKILYCVIGGLAVNAYAEPVVSLDLDVIITAADTKKLLAAFSPDYTVKEEKHSINISVPFSDLRIQIQTDSRYQEFIRRAVTKTVLGYELSVATLEDVIKGKLWAYSDPERRESKRQKDLADILRLVEAHPELKALLPPELHGRIRS